MSNRVAIINHGLSNLSSIARALERCGGKVSITEDPDDLAQADRIVLPGVGSVPAAMANLSAKGLDRALQNEVARRRVPVLGICLGMQLLADSSAESGQTRGLGLIPGEVIRLEAKGEERIPHMGWNAVEILQTHPLFAGVSPQADFYFVHSYHLRCSPDHVVTRTPFCAGFVSAAASGSIMAVQFHPEKSQKQGFKLLSNFLAI